MRHVERGGVSTTDVESYNSPSVVKLQNEPILRLGKIPSHESPHRTEYSNDPYSLEKIDNAPPLAHFTLHGPADEKSMPKVNDHEDYTEEYNTNEHGLSWGRKTCRRHVWQERWLQQETPQRKFGHNVGSDVSLNQRWTESWNRDQDGSMRIQKRIQEVDITDVPEDTTTSDDDTSNHLHKKIRSPLAVVKEDWEEEISVSADGSKTIKKRGTQKCRDRVWEEITIEAKGHFIATTEDTKPTEEIDAVDNVGQGSLPSLPLKAPSSDVIKETTFTEQIGEMSRGRKTRQMADGTVMNSDWYQCATEGPNEWIEESYTLMDGSRWGKKSGTNQRNEKWYEKWRKGGDGSYETDKWTEGGNGIRWGEKDGKASDGEYYHEEWEKGTLESKEDEEPLIKSYSTIRKKWTSASGGNSWGESTSNDSQHSIIDGRRVLIEKRCDGCKWHDDGYEENSDHWQAVTSYDKTSESEKRVKESGWSEGAKRNGDKWGSRWLRIRDGKEVQEGVESDGLSLVVNWEDKWWCEANGNSWGHCDENNPGLGIKRYKKWYNNGKEREEEWWETKQDKSRRGAKLGHREDGTSWSENWAKDADGQLVVDKEWSEYVAGESRKWGERMGHEGRAQWTFSWGNSEMEGRFTEWSTHWDDDGFGNFKTQKERKTWRDGAQTEWSLDRYGECLGKSEKWAVKEGSNESGDKWHEKWNETNDHKSAVKSGTNAQGDAWAEEWGESPGKKWAKKVGKNNEGREWEEEWFEDGSKKGAKKKCNLASGEAWQEEWGEDICGDDSGEKWAKKWAQNAEGSRWGQSWGDRWTGTDGHRWGEIWQNDDVHKWWHNTDGRPDGC